MTSIIHLAKNKKWRFYFLLPVVILPFLALLFFTLGGGTAKTGTQEFNPPGLNVQLPDAHFGSKKEKNKLGLYEASKLDSERHVGKSLWDYLEPDSAMVNQTSFAHDHPLDRLDTSSTISQTNTTHSSLSQSGPRSNAEREKELENKLQALQRELDKPAPTRHSAPASEQASQSRTVAKLSKSDERKEERDNDGEAKRVQGALPPDPEMVQLNHMLDKLLIIQHPDMKPDLMTTDNNAPAFNHSVSDEKGNNTLSVFIPRSQTLVSGATICLQLTEPARVGDLAISADQLLYGVVSLSSERLKIQIKSLRVGKTIIPVNLEGYDLDGLAGVYIPGSINRDVSKESVDQGMGALSLSTLDPSVSAQAASAGIQAAKSLISRKVKLVRVTVPSGYQLLLKDSH